jgi:hypothetical protein
LTISKSNVKQFVEDTASLLVGAKSLKFLDSNYITSSPSNIIGRVIPFSNGNSPPHILNKDFTIVSRNCCFNTFNASKIDDWLLFVNALFYDGVYIVCLQDVPYRFVEQFECVGHVAYVCYGVGHNDDLICNAIIFNSAFISNTELQNLNFYYFPEAVPTFNTFVAGCFYTELSYSESFCECVIGSVCDSFASSVFLRRVNWERRFNWMKLVSERSSFDSIFVGDFNPRTRSKLTDERPMVKTAYKKLNNFIYLTRLIPFVLLSLIGNTARKELLSCSGIGVITPEFTTMKSRKLFGFIPLDTAKLQWTFDAVQTTVSPTKVMITRMHQDDLSDHFGLFVSIRT